MADALNDTAFFIDILAPYLSPTMFFPLTCLSSLLRSLVGVAGGATRMAIVRHQARRDNLADVAAKDGSQETMVNVISLVVSLVLLPQMDGRPVAVWTLFVLFTAVHLYSNYRAVRALKLSTLNQQRFEIALKYYLQQDNTAPSVSQCNEQENVILPQSLFGRRHFGCQLKSLPAVRTGVQRIVNSSAIVVYDEEADIGWIALSTSASESECFDSVFQLEYYSLTQRWPSSVESSRFRSAMLGAGWELSTHQMNIDEWRYRELER